MTEKWFTSISSSCGRCFMGFHSQICPFEQKIEQRETFVLRFTLNYSVVDLC